ncbi:uncharacterized protein ACNLHF_023307 isoform 2-T2 [Anomaloglossus baeobatrachus]|uniref:uncharacterized protein LOC142317000 isoform X2 n=1 Tax=Anomaloglossus baeobatrachus TaxID=238106 RepID=UPI003F4FC70F
MSVTRSKAANMYAICTACKLILPEPSTYPHCDNCANMVVSQPGASAGVPPAASVQVAEPPAWVASFTQALSKSFADSMGQLSQTLLSMHQPPPQGVSAAPSSAEPSEHVLGPRPPKRRRTDPPPSSSHGSDSQAEVQGEEDSFTVGSDAASMYPIDLSESDADVSDLIASINSVLNLNPQESEDQPSLVEVHQFTSPKKPRSMFFNHSSFQTTVNKPRACPDKRFPKRSSDDRFPFPPEVVKDWAQSPKVDPPVSRISARTVVAVADGTSLKDPTDRQVDLLARSVFEAAGASFSPSFAAVWALKAISASLTEIHSLSRDSIPEMDTLTARASAFASYAMSAVLEASHRTAVASANSLAIRRILWLREWKADASSKKYLASLPFTGSRLFGEQLDDIIKEATGGKSTSLPQAKPKKPTQGRNQSRFRSFRSSNWSSSKPTVSSTTAKDRKSNWRAKPRPQKTGGAAATKAASS